MMYDVANTEFLKKQRGLITHLSSQCGGQGFTGYHDQCNQLRVRVVPGRLPRLHHALEVHLVHFGQSIGQRTQLLEINLLVAARRRSLQLQGQQARVQK